MTTQPITDAVYGRRAADRPKPSGRPRNPQHTFPLPAEQLAALIEAKRRVKPRRRRGKRS